MKKPKLDVASIQILKNRAIKFEKRRLDHKRWKKEKNKKENGFNVYELKRLRRLRQKYWDYQKVIAPKNFSFVNNPSEVVRFIKDLEYHYNNRNKVYVIMKNVEILDYGAIVVLLSIMVKFKASGIVFNGDFPLDKKAKLLLKKSGFFENLFKDFKESERYNISTNLEDGIHTHAWKDVDSVLSSEIIAKSTKVIWGEERRCQGVQRALIELMQNTNNHAEIGRTGEKHWWLSVNPIKEDKKVCFSFVDFGVGVFTNLESKNENSKFYKWAEKLSQLFRFNNNADVLKLILDGVLHKTVTEKHYRGKGLPGIAEAMRRNQLSNLHLITNDVYCNASKNEYRTMKDSFSGTFIYWEISEKNESCKQNTI